MSARFNTLSFQIASSLAIVFGVGLLTLFIAGQNAIRITDDATFARQERLATRHLEAAISALPEQQRSATVWDAALENVEARDEKWLNDNLGTWMQDYFGHDENYVLSPAGTPVFAAIQGKVRPPRSYTARGPEIAPLVAQLRERMEEVSAGQDNPYEELAEVAVVRPIRFDDRVAIISIVPIVSDSGDILQAPGTENLHVAVRYVDAQLAEAIGLPIELGEVGFEDTAPTGARAGIPVTGPSGEALAWLTWKPERPGMNLFFQMLPPMLGVGLASGVLLLWIVQRLLRVSGRLQASEAQALKDIAALKEAREAAKAADQAKMNFMSVVSHELRTPLTVILGYARLGKNLRMMPASKRLGDALLREPVDAALVEKTSDELLDFAQTGMEKIERSGEHLLFLVNQLLDFAKMETGRLEVEPEICNAEEVLEPVIDQMRILTDQKGLVLETRTSACLMVADVLRTRQILINLLGNAIKFTDRGKVSVAVTETDHEIRVDVSDTGIGIQDHELKNIFEAFHQTDPSSSRSAGGTGLGLSLARELAELEGGSITVRSEVGVGSTFTLSLPRPTSAVLEKAA
ncbi:histidine kinase [Aquicoccus sp. SCR17]|nr:histidine kinase [Carideicomes alvinocaridis]